MSIRKTLIFLAVIVLLAVSMLLAPWSPILPITIIFGGLAYVLFWMMAATSNNFSMRLLGRWWKCLHTFGMHYIWLIFFQSWVGGALEAPWYWGFVVVAIGGLGLRILAWFKHRAMAVPAGA